MPQFQNGAASVHYEIIGSGRPLLLIAGTASDGASWGPLLPLLPDRQLILIDNRGSGRTKVEGPIEHGQMVDDCAALLDHLGVKQADVVGHSLGGYLGLGLAAMHPERVRRLVTMGTAYTSPRINRVFSGPCATLLHRPASNLVSPALSLAFLGRVLSSGRASRRRGRRRVYRLRIPAISR